MRSLLVNPSADLAAHPQTSASAYHADTYLSATESAPQQRWDRRISGWRPAGQFSKLQTRQVTPFLDGPAPSRCFARHIDRMLRR